MLRIIILTLIIINIDTPNQATRVAKICFVIVFHKKTTTWMQRSHDLDFDLEVWAEFVRTYMSSTWIPYFIKIIVQQKYGRSLYSCL